MAYIEFDEAGRKRRVPLRGRPFLIGRAETCDLVLDSGFISGEHLQLELQLHLKDLDSSNGTFIDDRKVCDLKLSDRTRINLGGEKGLEITVDLADLPVDRPLAEPTMQFGTEIAGSTPEVDELRAALAAKEAELAAALAGGAAAAAPSPEPAAELAAEPANADEAFRERARARIAELEDALGRSERRVADLQSGRTPEPADAPATSGGNGASGESDEEVARLKRELEIERATNRELTTALHAQQGSIEAIGEKDDEVRRAKHELEQVRKEQVERVQAPGGAATPGPATEILEPMYERSKFLEKEQGIFDLVVNRPNLLSDCGFALAELFDFVRAMEKTISRFADHLRSAVPTNDQTIVPGHQETNLTDCFARLLLKGGDANEVRFSKYLQGLREWAVISLKAYKISSGRWGEQQFTQFCSTKIEKEASPAAWLGWFGLEGIAHWKAYEKLASRYGTTGEGMQSSLENSIEDLARAWALEEAEQRGLI